MLVREKLSTQELSASEKLVADFMLEKGSQIESMTIKDIAAQTWTSPATMVRIAQRLGYNGWNELKSAFLQEQEYLDTHFCKIDANYPFQKGDARITIASKICQLGVESLEDTFSLQKDVQLHEAGRLLDQAENIYVFAVSNNLMLGEMFQFQMRRILKRVQVCTTQGETQWAARLASTKDCALIISYSGESPILVKVASYLREQNIPIVSITSIGSSTVADLSTVSLRITTREKLYSKLGTFSTGFAVHYLLDVLYAIVFERNYDSNLQDKIIRGFEIEKERFSTSDILREVQPDPDEDFNT